eukprot:CAMPEP_0201676428 /NCGR_PEP_ID=MMETSP0494-20130426/41733_1 /ASSEMBLY_ACC=CAM_ASM_000839 /TAXON_ID=420259 /ORGANISM="Thalassiosira gravida, Strain GMp14c1" /LENGTH=65 /DNA_ID=CAMNT_0048159143 /DNA_START=100 /DNA_END=294 /DNA_ORIENTATION=-
MGDLVEVESNIFECASNNDRNETEARNYEPYCSMMTFNEPNSSSLEEDEMEYWTNAWTFVSECSS